ncbi:MAG: hypothetical protein QOJ29_5044 [Thermoleophilaceae bacterium]|jgi:hypothetical protein|nr:hypothetical protein [Thermoleophilaceae bacterium]
MSENELASVISNRGITPRGENFATQDRGYIDHLAVRHPRTYDNVVRFEVRPGTRDALIDAGGTSRPKPGSVRVYGVTTLNLTLGVRSSTSHRAE